MVPEAPSQVSAVSGPWFRWVSGQVHLPQGTAAARGHHCVCREPFTYGGLNLKRHKVGTSLSSWNRVKNGFVSCPVCLSLCIVGKRLGARADSPGFGSQRCLGCVTLDHLPGLSNSQFPHLHNGYDKADSQSPEA